MSRLGPQAMSRPGVVDLRDLASRYAWNRLAITSFLEAAKTTPVGPASAAFAPPRVVVAIAPADNAAHLGRSRAWLEDAAQVIVVRARQGSIAESDPMLGEVIDAEWTQALETLRVPVQLMDWRSDEDVRAVIELAVARAEAIGPPPEPVAPPAIIEHAPGPRIAIEPMPSWLSLERSIAARLVQSAERVTLHASNDVVDLHDPSALVRFASEDVTRSVAPDGRPLVRDARNLWRIDDDRFEAFGHLALGFDGHQRVGWTGHRMMVYWLYSGRRGFGFLSASDHDFPCGPAKKLYGYEDNEPLGVALAPALDLVAYRFEHDVLLTSAVPIAWRTAGPLLVADFAPDRSRAVFFAKTPDGFPIDDLLDEDARDQAPALVLGPTADVRYAVDLSHGVHRITSVEPNVGAMTRVGGPGEGFAVFDRQHQEVRRAAGRLLGGWWRWATVLEHDAYWREDLATGERYRIGPAEGTPLVAIGLPWTRNVVVILAAGERRWLSLV